MPGTSPQTHATVLERRHKAATLYLQGEQQYAIARALGVSQQQISFDLKAMRELWLDSMLVDFDAKKAQELAKIDQVELSYWLGWNRSLTPREVTLTEATEGGEMIGDDGTSRTKAPTRKASVRKEGQAGDPRFLDGVLKCVERRCAILGFDAPKKFAVNWDNVDDAQLARLAAGESPARVMAEA